MMFYTTTSQITALQVVALKFIANLPVIANYSSVLYIYYHRKISNT